MTRQDETLTDGALMDELGQAEVTQRPDALARPGRSPEAALAVALKAIGMEPPESEEDRLSETILGSQPGWQGNFLRTEVVEVELPDGTYKTRDVVRHPGAVAIVALDDQGRILLERQYRTALERVTLEIPAGKLEPGEDPEDAARRELEEETGMVAGMVRYLMPIAVAAGYSDEIIHLYMASGLREGYVHLDEGEFVEALWMDLSELIDLVLDGRIEDSKTVIAALLCDAMAHRLD